ncbi:MAG: tetratricopeptide repeat protein [Kordiimonadaceae bacterium]|nr:tetratricopeptide repeat protein [Kordiimonadaceae bacterium]
MKLIKTLKSLPLTIATAVLVTAVPLPEATPFFGADAAYAMQSAKPKNKQKTRKVPAMSLKFHKKVTKAQEAMDIGDLITAKQVLEAALLSRKINDYERATIWQFRAMVAFEEEDTAGTINAYEKILTFKDSIPVALEMNITYGLAQLYFSDEKYDKALRYAQKWEAAIDPTLISVSHMVFIAQLHYTRSDFPNAVNYIYRAINTAEGLDTVEVKENWYGLALSAHWEQSEYKKVRDVLEILLINWPKPVYWIQLAGVYQELGEEQTSFSITEAAYKQGFLDDKEAQLVQIAQIQIARDAPIKCAWILEKAFKEDRVEQSGKNNLTLGQCYMQAGEYAKSIKPLTIAAKEDADADLWFQIGQVEMQLDNLSKAIIAFDKTLDSLDDSKNKKSADKRFAATMMRGQALTELKRFKEAKSAFSSAHKMSKKAKKRKSVRQWRAYLKGEEAREKMLAGG